MPSISFTDMKGDIWAFTVNSEATINNLLIIFQFESIFEFSQKCSQKIFFEIFETQKKPSCGVYLKSDLNFCKTLIFTY